MGTGQLWLLLVTRNDSWRSFCHRHGFPCYRFRSKPNHGQHKAMHEPLPLTECDKEPIHIPGAVQPHGALLAVDPSTWRVTHASANLAAFLGTEAANSLGHPLADLFGEDVTSLLRHDVQARRANPGGTALDAGTAGGRLRLVAHASRSGEICIDL